MRDILTNNIEKDLLILRQLLEAHKAKQPFSA